MLIPPALSTTNRALFFFLRDALRERAFDAIDEAAAEGDAVHPVEPLTTRTAPSVV
jgi:hypothetical protein